MNRKRTTWLAIGLLLAMGIASTILAVATMSGFGTGHGDVVLPAGQSGVPNAAVALLCGAALLAVSLARQTTRRRHLGATASCR